MAGEEERRTMDLLLAVPVSRTRVLLEKTAAMVVGTLGLAAATGATLVVEGRLFDMVIPVDKGAAMLHPRCWAWCSALSHWRSGPRPAAPA